MGPPKSRTKKSRSVCILHGRDLAARDELEKYLQALGLETPRFEEIAGEFKRTPYIKEVLDKAINEADAIIALFTPDEQAALYSPKGEHLVNDRSGGARWQARPNVIFEAGVALGKAPQKTLLVTLGSDVTLFSDLAGMHIIELEKPTAKKLLYDRLEGILRNLPKLPGAAAYHALPGNFQGCERSRWPHYDELHALEEKLQRHHIKRGRTLLRVAKYVALNRPGRRDWREHDDSRLLIEIVENKFGEDDAGEAYWWFLVYGVLRFDHIDHWYYDDGEDYKASLDYSWLAERGARLLAKLSLVRP